MFALRKVEYLCKNLNAHELMFRVKSFKAGGGSEKDDSSSFLIPSHLYENAYKCMLMLYYCRPTSIKTTTIKKCKKSAPALAKTSISNRNFSNTGARPKQSHCCSQVMAAFSKHTAWMVFNIHICDAHSSGDMGPFHTN